MMTTELALPPVVADNLDKLKIIVLLSIEIDDPEFSGKKELTDEDWEQLDNAVESPPDAMEGAIHTATEHETDPNYAEGKFLKELTFEEFKELAHELDLRYECESAGTLTQQYGHLPADVFVAEHSGGYDGRWWKYHASVTPILDFDHEGTQEEWDALITLLRSVTDD